MSQTLAFVHTSHVVVPMFAQLAKEILPDFNVFHMADESLIRNTIAAQGLTKVTTRRILAAIASAREGGADAVLVTCSSIGAAVEMAQRLFDFPVLRVDEPMAEAAVRMGHRVGVAATLRTTLEPTVKLLREKAVAADRSDIEVVPCLCEGAFDAVLAGDTARHDRMVAESLVRLMKTVDVVVLAQASMARVLDTLPRGNCHPPVLTSPELAVRHARTVLSAACATPA